MSLFKSQEQFATVYKPTDTNSTKITKWTSTGSFSILINILRMGFDANLIEGVELAPYRANVSGTNASLMKKGYLIKVGTVYYEIMNEPRLNKLFNRYKVDLKKTEGTPAII